MLHSPDVENDVDAGLWDDEGCDYMSPAPAVAAHIARHDPARVLANVAALRAVIALMEQIKDESSWYAAMKADDTLRALAQPYSDRPGFREEWRD